MKTSRVLELAGVLQEGGGGKRQGAVNMILATLQWAEGGKLTHAQVSKALGTAYDAGFADANKASSN